jgi:putative oxidoreductase
MCERHRGRGANGEASAGAKRSPRDVGGGADGRRGRMITNSSGGRAVTFLQRILATESPAVVLLIRLMVGAVFVSEGIQKFLFPGDPDRGAARFVRLGFSYPDFTSAFVASFEIVCGALILLGLLTRLAVIPTITIMVVAIATDVIPILRQQGFWDMAHAGRTDFCMLLGSLFLLWQGAGRWSMDARLVPVRSGA